jgi:hypothetical protein
MKNNILKRTLPVFLVLLFAFEMTNAQEVEPQLTNQQQEMYNFYNAQHKKLKKTGFILLGAGAGLFVVGAIVLADTTGQGDKAVGNGFLMLTVGGLSAIASIPVFIISGSRNRKAKAYLEAGTASMGNITFDNSRHASIGLKITF